MKKHPIGPRSELSERSAVRYKYNDVLSQKKGTTGQAEAQALVPIDFKLSYLILPLSHLF